MPWWRNDTDRTAADVLEKGAELYRERNQQYGDGFIVTGNVLAAMFPHGVELKTQQDFRRWHLFEWMVGKMVRYAANFSRGGHPDSMEDAVVYGAMVAFEDRIINGQSEVESAMEQQGKRKTRRA